MSDEVRCRVLYLAYWGALEPLGQSLVVPAVKKLAREGVDLTLVSFEKPADMEQVVAVEKLRRDFASAGVSWRPLRYHKRPKWPATFFDAFMALMMALRVRLTGRIDVVHARTFVSGPVGWLAARLLGAAFVYHNEGFYPDEQVDGGVWRAGSAVHRFARAIEGFLYDHADGLIVLSERAKATLLGRKAVRRKRTRIIVVPSAVDLEAFRPAKRPYKNEDPSLVYLGSIGGRYRIDLACRFVLALRNLGENATLSVISHTPREIVAPLIRAAGLPNEAWTLKALPHRAVPAELRKHSAGLLFHGPSIAGYGGSPTKVGEYWASGLPVVASPNAGDTDALIARHRVGVSVEMDSGTFEAAAEKLMRLLAEPKLARRCRRAAEEAYSLGSACARQRRLYRSVRKP